MKIFIAFRFTGENPDELRETIGKIERALGDAGHEPICSLHEEERFARERFSGRQIIEWGFRGIDASDMVLVLVKSAATSEGMLLEVGYALAKRKPIVLAVHRAARTTIVRKVTDSVIEFDTIDGLCEKLGQLQ